MRFTVYCNFARTKDTFDEYKKTECSRKFFEAHRGDITIYKAARDALKKYQGHPPKTKDISAELEILFAEKKDLYSGYKASRDDSRKLQEAKRNVDMFLQLTKAPEDKKERRQPQFADSFGQSKARYHVRHILPV